jgi:6-pyruvoyltetrahydropterin/6-carboxytetrahydropterin synthase
MLISKEIEIDTSHRVFQHSSKCFSVHGHRYKIEVGVDDKIIAVPGASNEGMVIDFSDLKQIMMEELDGGFDHGAIISENDYMFKYALVDSIKILFEDEEVYKILKNKIPYFKELEIQYLKDKERKWKIKVVPFIPTAENLARHWYTLIKPRLRERNISINHVKVWETPTSTAIYTKDDDRRWRPPEQKTLNI